jgi:enolase-phosphatase E1
MAILTSGVPSTVPFVRHLRKAPTVPLHTVVLDIEGTTSATAFVVQRLYPYSSERFAAWIEEHRDDPDTARAIGQVRDLIGDPSAGIDRIVEALRGWLAADEKVTALKTVQGRIWERGFASGDLVADFYPDVIPALRAWKAAGHDLYVFSSGSVTAQRCWFGHTPDGDLRPLLSGYFDTENAGAKRQHDSYLTIAAATGADPAHIVFLSDVVAELDAAREAGWHTVGVRRPGEPHYDRGVGDHLAVSSFAELDITGERPAVRGRVDPSPSPSAG